MVIASLLLPVQRQWLLKGRSHLQLRDSVGFAPTSLLSKLHAIYTYYYTLFSCEGMLFLLAFIVEECHLEVNEH